MRVILTTVATKKDAEKLASLLVAKRLAACVNILKLEGSVYKWKGKVQKGREFLLIIKSSAPYDLLERFISVNHLYQLPEIISLKPDRSSAKYLSWVKRSCL